MMYITKDKRILHVVRTRGYLRFEYRTGWWDGKQLSVFRSPSLPPRESRDQAQMDLDQYAADHTLEKLQRGCKVKKRG